MKKIAFLKKLPLLVIASGVVITVAFAQSNAGMQKHGAADTLPTKHKKIRDLDEALAEIDRGEAELNRAFKEIDRDKMESEIRNAMKNMETDMAKMKEDLARAMKELDFQKMNLEIQKNAKEIDSEKIKQEVKASISKIDMEKMKAEIEKVKEIDFQKMRETLANMQPQMEKAMKEAQVSIEAARKEITSYKNLVNALQKDGLLNKDKSYTVEYKNKELTVNGKKLSAENTKKYSEYLQDKEDFRLEKDEDGFDIRK